MLMPNVCGMKIHIAAVVGMLVCACPASAQSPATTQYGSYGSSYRAPAWGQVPAPPWGAYSGSIGQGGWQFNQTLQPTEPEGGVASNNTSGAFGNPQTGAGLFSSPDTRLKGRDRP